MGASIVSIPSLDITRVGRDQHRRQPSGRNRIDARLIRQGVMPNVAGHPTMDASTGAGFAGDQGAIQSRRQPKARNKAEGGVAWPLGARSPMPLLTTAMARYAQRFRGIRADRRRKHGGHGQVCLLRAGGFADVGNNLLLGIPGICSTDRPGSPLATEIPW